MRCALLSDASTFGASSKTLLESSKAISTPFGLQAPGSLAPSKHHGAASEGDSRSGRGSYRPPASAKCTYAVRCYCRVRPRTCNATHATVQLGAGEQIQQWARKDQMACGQRECACAVQVRTVLYTVLYAPRGTVFIGGLRRNQRQANY